MHITAQEKWVAQGLAEQAAAASQCKVIEQTTHQPNYCLDCNKSYFGWDCPYCGGDRVAIKKTELSGKDRRKVGK
ncbi:hypothetical protein KAR91_50620 [Candidatus Pacearchaeota archaeon]|nr:hypothetical protein [Candidatus Pacearchaeota archaeon]